MCSRCKSINTPSVYFFVSSDVLISSTKSISACVVDILVRNPYWFVDSIIVFWRTGIVEI